MGREVRGNRLEDFEAAGGGEGGFSNVKGVPNVVSWLKSMQIQAGSRLVRCRGSRQKRLLWHASYILQGALSLVDDDSKSCRADGVYTVEYLC